MSIKPEETKDGIKLRDTATGNLAGSIPTVGKDSAPTASPIAPTNSEPSLADEAAALRAFEETERQYRMAKAGLGLEEFGLAPTRVVFEYLDDEDEELTGLDIFSSTVHQSAPQRASGRGFAPDARFETFDGDLVNQRPLPYHKVFSDFPDFVVSATDALFASRPSQRSHEEREVAFKAWMNAIAEGYGVDNPAFNWYSERNEGVSYGGGYYQPSTHRLYIDEDAHSVTTFLHEYRHALQHLGAEMSSNDVEIDARAWSLSLYYRVRPELLTRLVKENRIFHIDPSLL